MVQKFQKNCYKNSGTVSKKARASFSEKDSE